MKIKKILLSSIAASTIITTVYADNSKIESINVWETEIESSSLNISGSAIETKQADHLSDLLRSLPGVDVGGTHSINNRINIRGLQDENLDITLDGAKIQNANMFHHIGNLLINPDLLKKVEIDVGTNSVVNGSLGGSITFETKDAEDLLENGDTFGGRVQVSYNSNDSESISAAGYGKAGENGDFLIYHNQVKTHEKEDGRGIETIGSAGDISNTLFKYGHKLNDSNKVTISYDTLKDEGDYSPRPDFGRDYNEFRTGTDTFDTEYTRETITLKHELDLDKTKVETSIYSNENELERYEGPLTSGAAVRPGGLTEGLLNGKVKTVGLNTKAQTNVLAGNVLHTLTYGGLYDKQTSKVTWNGEKYGTDEDAISKAIFIEDKMDFDNGLLVTPGIRYNIYDLDGANGEFSDNEVTYSLATEYALTPEFSLLANVTTLFKGVEMVDILATNRTSGSESESSGVKSETGINKEIGFRYLENDILGADSVGVSFKYFNTTINDYINIAYASDYSYSYLTNSGDLDLKGFELGFSYTKGDFDSLITYSRTDTKFKDTGLTNATDPGDSITLNFNYSILPNLSISTESIFMKKETDTAGDEYNEKEAYNVHDIAVNWHPESIKALTVIAGVDNIFDEEYTSHTSESRTFAGFSTADYEAGRNIKITLAYKF